MQHGVGAVITYLHDAPQWEGITALQSLTACLGACSLGSYCIFNTEDRAADEIDPIVLAVFQGRELRAGYQHPATAQFGSFFTGLNTLNLSDVRRAMRPDGSHLYPLHGIIVPVAQPPLFGLKQNVGLRAVWINLDPPAHAIGAAHPTQLYQVGWR